MSLAAWKWYFTAFLMRIMLSFTPVFMRKRRYQWCMIIGDTSDLTRRNKISSKKLSAYSDVFFYWFNHCENFLCLIKIITISYKQSRFWLCLLSTILLIRSYLRDNSEYVYKYTFMLQSAYGTRIFFLQWISANAELIIKFGERILMRFDSRLSAITPSVFKDVIGWDEMRWGIIRQRCARSSLLNVRLHARARDKFPEDIERT